MKFWSTKIMYIRKNIFSQLRYFKIVYANFNIFYLNIFSFLIESKTLFYKNKIVIRFNIIKYIIIFINEC
jgi:hypothetical protein